MVQINMLSRLVMKWGVPKYHSDEMFRDEMSVMRYRVMKCRAMECSLVLLVGNMLFR